VKFEENLIHAAQFFLPQNGHISKNWKRHNSKPEVDIDPIPTPFFVVCQCPQSSVYSVRQVAPQVPELKKVPRPQKFKPNFLELQIHDFPQIFST